MWNHWLWMVLGCGLPLLFIFLAPALGITGGTALFTFIIVMFGIHLLMPMKHSNHSHSRSNKDPNQKGDNGGRNAGHQHQ